MGYLDNNNTKTIVNFRLSDATRDELNEIVAVQRALDALNGEPWLAERRNRTQALELAIEHYALHMKGRLADREKAISAMKDEAKQLLANEEQKKLKRSRRKSA